MNKKGNTSKLVSLRKLRRSKENDSFEKEIIVSENNHLKFDKKQQKKTLKS